MSTKFPVFSCFSHLILTGVKIMNIAIAISAFITLKGLYPDQ